MAHLTLSNVSKVYDGQITAVDNLNLDVSDGELMAIVGPSGCGKTTTLRMIAGLEGVSAGTISMSGKVINKVPPKDRNVTMVFQTYALYPHLNVFQNIAFGLKLNKVPRTEIENRVKNVAQMLGIGELLKSKTTTLSGGQRQRVALGRAIVGKPGLFLFDEPLSNLDAALRTRMRIQLKSLHSQLDATSVYVTHDQTEAMTLGDKICVLKAGVVQQTGEPREVYDKPSNKFVGGFFGTPPMNFLNGSVHVMEGIPYFASECGSISLHSEIIECMSDRNAGEMVVMGIRPEHLRLGPDSGPKQNSISARVTAVEQIGLFKSVYVESILHDNIIVATLSDETIDLKSTVRVYFDTRKIHLFEHNERGRNIGLRPAN